MASPQILIHFPNLTTKTCPWLRVPSPSKTLSSQRRKNGYFFSRNGRALRFSPMVNLFRREGFDVLQRKGRKVSLLVVRAKQGFNSDDGGWDKSSSSRVLGNLALAIGFTYLTLTGQLGWLVDALVSIWLLAFLLPIVGLGAFFWFAGRDIVQSNCPNCGNYFQIFKSSMKDGVQFCPYCTQPFSVQGKKFVREPTRFSSKRAEAPGQVFSRSPRRSEQGASSTTIVDIEAEVKDME